MPTESFDVAVIGAGASGVLLTAHYRRAHPRGRLAVIEAGARAARGLAYGTPYGAHLLNVPAGRMSVFETDRDHFVRWLVPRLSSATADTYAPRHLFGDYLHEVLQDANPHRVGGTAVGITRDREGWSVHLHDGRVMHAQAVVLALGNLPPDDPLRLDDPPPGYLRDPWAPGAAAGLDPDAPVLLIGTGLTMIDLALALRHEGHRGAIHAISRHARLPQVHAPQPLRPIAAQPEAPSPRAAMHWIRGELGRGSDWRQVVDALRPQTAAIWQSWTLQHRASFLRHARNLWDVHRHRMPPEIAAELGGVGLQVHRGRVIKLTGNLDAHTDRGEVIHAARVINCTGPATDYARLDLPLVVQMRRAGWLVPDALRLGVETAPDGALIGSDGQPVEGLFTMGPLRRPALWESTAIPEIRAQAAALAERLRAWGPSPTDASL